MMYYFEHYKIAAKSKLAHFFFKNKYKRYLFRYKDAFENKQGLEIGGPSKLFATDFLPIYNWAKVIDGCNFSANTLWEGDIRNATYSYAQGKIGKQYILDGTNLHEIPDRKYDFVLSCHNLEHIANPLLAIQEWLRVIKKSGFILLVLPDKRFTFDRNRPYTTFEHLLDDLKTGIKEYDLTHLPEIVQLHDLSLDPLAGRDQIRFKERSQNNFTLRAMHHHVFSTALLEESLGYFNVKTTGQYFVPPFHQIIIGQKG